MIVLFFRNNMDLKYVVLTIIKILISVPTIMLVSSAETGAVLMGGHIDNKSSSTSMNSSLMMDYDLYDSQEVVSNVTVSWTFFSVFFFAIFNTHT